MEEKLFLYRKSRNKSEQNSQNIIYGLQNDQFHLSFVLCSYYISNWGPHFHRYICIGKKEAERAELSIPPLTTSRGCIVYLIYNIPDKHKVNQVDKMNISDISIRE